MILPSASAMFSPIWRLKLAKIEKFLRLKISLSSFATGRYRIQQFLAVFAAGICRLRLKIWRENLWLGLSNSTIVSNICLCAVYSFEYQITNYGEIFIILNWNINFQISCGKLYEEFYMIKKWDCINCINCIIYYTYIHLVYIVVYHY